MRCEGCANCARRRAVKNPYLKGKIEKRKKARDEWMKRQITPKVKDWVWAHKFRFCPHLGVWLALKHEFLDAHTEQEFLHDAWR